MDLAGQMYQVRWGEDGAPLSSEKESREKWDSLDEDGQAAAVQQQIVEMDMLHDVREQIRRILRENGMDLCTLNLPGTRVGIRFSSQQGILGPAEAFDMSSAGPN